MKLGRNLMACDCPDARKGLADYYFMATRELDWEHIATKTGFQYRIEKNQNRLNNNILTTFK